MAFADVSLVGLRVVREIAERGSFTAAAASLGYIQSAVSRQVAVIERAAGGPVFERRRQGVQVTARGRVILRHAATVLDAIDAADRELHGVSAETGVMRLGVFPSAGAVPLPQALTLLRPTHPGIKVITRDGGTPVLVRALRAGSLDLAVLGSSPPFRAPDNEEPALIVETLTERNLCVAVASTHPLAQVRVRPWMPGWPSSPGHTPLRGQRWVASQRDSIEINDRHQLKFGEPVACRVDNVGAGCGLTTVPAVLAAAALAGG